MAGYKGQAAFSEGLKIVPRPFRKGPPKGQWPDLARLKSGKRRGTAFGVPKGPAYRLPDRKTEESRASRTIWPGPSPRPRGAGATHRPGAKAPGQRPSRPWRALRTRRDGRWPSLRLGERSCGTVVPCRPGKRGAFPCPPGTAILFCRIRKGLPYRRRPECFLSYLPRRRPAPTPPPALPGSAAGCPWPLRGCWCRGRRWP